MKRYLGDTSFLSALFNKDDVNHLNAKKIAQEVKDEYFIIPSVVIAEIASFTKNKRLRSIILENTLHMASEIFPLGESNIFNYIVFREELPNNLTAMDSIILFSSVERSAELLTFDNDLKKVYRKCFR